MPLPLLFAYGVVQYRVLHVLATSLEPYPYTTLFYDRDIFFRQSIGLLCSHFLSKFVGIKLVFYMFIEVCELYVVFIEVC